MLSEREVAANYLNEASWQPSLPRPQARVAAALQGPLLPHSGNADAPPLDTIALTPAALAEAAAASGARLTKAAAASGARQPAAQDEESWGWGGTSVK